MVLDNGAIPIFVHLLRLSNSDVQEQAVWALGNIAGESPACRNLVLSGREVADLEANDALAEAVLRYVGGLLVDEARHGAPAPRRVAAPCRRRSCAQRCENLRVMRVEAC